MPNRISSFLTGRVVEIASRDDKPASTAGVLVSTVVRLYSSCSNPGSSAILWCDSGFTAITFRILADFTFDSVLPFRKTVANDDKQQRPSPLFKISSFNLSLVPISGEIKSRISTISSRIRISSDFVKTSINLETAPFDNATNFKFSSDALMKPINFARESESISALMMSAACCLESDVDSAGCVTSA